AVRMYRDIWFVSVSVAAVMRPGEAGRGRWWVVPALVAGAFLAARLANTVGLGRSTDYAAAQAMKYPVRAVDHMKAHHPPGPVFNDFDWGGYLIWVAPEYPVSIDGRTNLYGNERMLRSFDTWSSETGWQTDPDLLAARL